MKSNQFPTGKPRYAPMHGSTSGSPVLIKTSKRYALYAGNEVKLKDVPYPVLVAEKRKLADQGLRFLSIKPIR
jgi:hypothetical protein